MRGAVNLVIHILVDGCDDAVALQEEFSGYPPAMPWLPAVNHSHFGSKIMSDPILGIHMNLHAAPDLAEIMKADT